MSNSYTATVTPTLETSHHGQISSVHHTNDMELDPAAPRELNDKHKDPDPMDAPLDRSASHEHQQNDLERPKSPVDAIQAERAQAPVQVKEGSNTSNMAERSGKTLLLDASHCLAIFVLT